MTDDAARTRAVEALALAAEDTPGYGEEMLNRLDAHPEAKTVLAAWLVPGVVHGSPHTHDDDGAIHWIRYPATQPDTTEEQR